MDALALCKIADERRLDALEMDFSAHTGHIGGAMSSAEVMACLYYEVMDTEKIKQGAPDRDRFILSKGHCAEMLYAVLADKGFFPAGEKATYAQFKTRLAEHPTNKVPGVEIATGALGHGFSVGVGMAIAMKKQAPSAHIYVLMGDGEQAEGSVWEAAMSAAKYELSNLTAIVDRNRLQITGSTETVMPLYDLRGKYEAFGFKVIECDGHSPEKLVEALQARGGKKPIAIIANTVKGKGVSFMENRAEWHHTVPNEEQYNTAKSEIMQRLEADAI